MDDYIERKSAIQALCKDCVDDGYCKNGQYGCEEVPALLAIPAADVVKKKYSYWILSGCEHRAKSECSLCGCGIEIVNDNINVLKAMEEIIKNWSFCHSCGAKIIGIRRRDEN